MNVGLTAVELDKLAKLFEGFDVIVQRYVNESPLASELLAPFNVTADPVTTLCADPALAIGAILAVDAVIVTVAAALSIFPSFTNKLTT